MWDEQERFANAALKFFAGLFAVVGVIAAATSLATEVPDVFVVYLLLVGGLGAIGLAYALAVWGLGAILIGSVRGLRWCFHRSGTLTHDKPVTPTDL
jgi:hypothetical protein